jgi:hypothetical protein
MEKCETLVLDRPLEGSANYFTESYNPDYKKEYERGLKVLSQARGVSELSYNNYDFSNAYFVAGLFIEYHFVNSSLEEFIRKGLHRMYKKAVELHSPTIFQLKIISRIFQSISKSHNSFSNIHIKVSVDSEILIIKEVNDGFRYIVIGENDGELYYTFTGKGNGQYSVTKFLGNYPSIQEFVDYFLR